MLLGDLIARFEDPVFTQEILLGLDDLALTTRIANAAAEERVTHGEFVMQSIVEFVSRAGDDEWLTLIGLISRADNPAHALLH